MALDLNVALGLHMYEESESESEDVSTTSIVYSSDEFEEPSSETPKESVIEKSPITAKVKSEEHDDIPASEKVCDETDLLDTLIVDYESKLEVGFEFGSIEEAYVFYCEYGRQKGFSVRRGDQRYKGNTNDIRWKEFVCHCAGLQYAGVNNGCTTGSSKQVKRSKCLAKIRINPTASGVWKNTLFVKEHNHPLLARDQTYLMRSSRTLLGSRLGVLQAMKAAGASTTMACGFIEDECGGLQNVGYIRKDAYNKLYRMKPDKHAANGDAIALVDFFNRKTNSEQLFFWRAQYDDENRIKHFFFRDSRCLSDFQCFGDVLSIDTTHKTNKYNLSCAPFVGVNHHNTSVMYGVGFLSDETSETFEWLLGVFLESMNGKQPKVVFSDQCRALMNAIDKIFHSATHRLCQWHVNNNAVKHFGALNKNEEFKRMWYRCMTRVESEEEFDNLWNDMMATHVPPDNTWLPEMYTLRKRWASVFSQKVFTAGMVATSRSEGTNRVLKAVIRSSSSLYDFACAYERVQARWRDVERAEDATCLWVTGQFVKQNDFITQAATTYTRKIYKKFEYQCKESWNVVIDWINATDVGGRNIEFKATRTKHPNARPRTVTFNLDSKSASCSCHMWEGHGIFCRHILKIYNFMNVQSIPDEFILKRWTKHAKQGVFFDQAKSLRVHTDNHTRFLDFSNLLMRCQYEMICAAKDSLSAQEYLLKMMETTKGGFCNHISAQPEQWNPTSAIGGEKIQVQNPKKVKQKGALLGKKKDKTQVTNKRGARRKCPGVSTRSRKRRTTEFSQSFDDGLDLNISLTQPIQKANYGGSGPFQTNNSGQKEFMFFATQ